MMMMMMIIVMMIVMIFVAERIEKEQQRCLQRDAKAVHCDGGG